MKNGDRVRYTGNHPDTNQPEMIGALGTIEGIIRSGNVPVMWDDEAHRGRANPERPRGHYIENLELVADTIDWHQPIELDDGTPLIIVAGGLGRPFIEVRAEASKVHPAFPKFPCYCGTARADNGLIISNHKYRVRNRIVKTKTIDTTKPLEVLNRFNTRFPVTFVTETSDNNILIDTTTNAGLSDGWIIFDKQGKFVRSSDGRGDHLTLANPVVETTHFTPLYRNGRPVAGDGYPTFAGMIAGRNPDLSEFYLKVTKRDGVIVSANVGSVTG